MSLHWLRLVNYNSVVVALDLSVCDQSKEKLFYFASVAALILKGNKSLLWEHGASMIAEFNPSLFFRYGKIVSTKAILDKTTNKCKGEVWNNQLVERLKGFEVLRSSPNRQQRQLFVCQGGIYLINFNRCLNDFFFLTWVTYSLSVDRLMNQSICFSVGDALHTPLVTLVHLTVLLLYTSLLQ